MHRQELPIEILSGSVSAGFFAMGSDFFHLPGLAATASVRAEKMTFECNFFLIPVWYATLTGWSSVSK
jgi:hypothetical protein